MGMPYFARLWWDSTRHRGHANVGDVEVELHEAPPILGHPAEIDYGEAHPDQLAYPPEIRDHDSDRKREMTAPEVKAVHDWLRGLALVVRRFMRRKKATKA